MDTYHGARLDRLFMLIGSGTLLFIVGFMLGNLIALTIRH